MGRKAKIDKQMILEAAYALLDEGGIEAVAIKSIAQRLGCSTQPVSWHFGSMTELKKELYFFAGEKLYEGLMPKMAGRPAFEAFFISGVHFISTACEHPNVFRFTNVDNPEKTIGESVTDNKSIFSFVFDEHAVAMIAKEYNISEDILNETVRDVVIYTYGLAVMMIFDNFRLPREEACRMVFNAGVKMISDIGIDTSPYTFEQFMGEI